MASRTCGIGWRALALLAAGLACTADPGEGTVDAGRRPTDVPRDAAGDARLDAADAATPADTGATDTGRAADTPAADAPGPADTGVDVPVARCAAGVDSDRDGVPNDAECRQGTDPFNPDSDMDGLSDGVEGAYPRTCVATDAARQRRPAVACARDADCVAGERCAGLVPTQRDTDRDGVPDGAEDPNGDGRIEVARGETDPRVADTDGDGVSDGMSGIAICRPAGLATVVQTALPMAPTQTGYDPAWGAARRVTGTMGRAALAMDDPATGVAGLVAALPVTGDVRTESARVETLVTGALGAGVTGVLVGRSLTTHEMNPAVTSTYRVSRSTTATALRDLVVTPLVGAAAPPAPVPAGTSSEFLVDVTTVRRTMGTSAGTADVIVTVAPRAAYEDRARPTAIRATDLANATAVAQADRGLGFNCQTFRAPGPPLVDFVWTVDVSVSMGPYQESIGNTAQQFFADLGAAGVDFRVAVLRAQVSPFDFARPGLRFVPSTDPMGARDLAWRVTVARYMSTAGDTLAPYPHTGDFSVQIHEEPIAAGVLAFDGLQAGAMAGAPLDQRVRDGAQLVAFFVADETGNNDETRYFARDPARWGRTYPERIASAIAYYRTRRILTFGMVNDQGTACAANDPRDMRKCVILGNGGAYIPIRTATPAEVAAAMRRIVDAVAGSTSPYALTRSPITSTLKVRVRGMDVPRSRAEGFDYDAAANAVVLYGARYRPARGDEVVVSYRVWQPCPTTGARCAGDGDCCAPHACVEGRCAPPCRASGAACASHADCCAPARCEMGACRPPPTCIPRGATCATELDACCAPLRCVDGRCDEPQPCRPTAATCARDADCCSGRCASGRCACVNTTGRCTTPEDCCSRSCVGGLCAPG